MSPVYLNGIPPTYNVSTLVAAANVQTPYLQGSAAAGLITVPPVATPETMVLFTAVQTLSSKTLLQPVITTGTFTSPVIQAPVLTGGTITSATINTSVLNTPTVKMTGGGVLTGGIMHDTVRGSVPQRTQLPGPIRTLDFSTADVFMVDLAQTCTLTIAYAATSKFYNVILRQTSTGCVPMSWMTGFVCNHWASGPTQSSGAVDIWQIFYDSITGKHYAISGSRDIQ